MVSAESSGADLKKASIAPFESGNAGLVLALTMSLKSDETGCS